MGGNFPGGNFPGGSLPGGSFLGGSLPGGSFPGGNFPDTVSTAKGNPIGKVVLSCVATPQPRFQPHSRHYGNPVIGKH